MPHKSYQNNEKEWSNPSIAKKFGVSKVCYFKNDNKK
jgi:hypothetical protein